MQHIKKNNAETIKMLLEKGANVNQITSNGLSALINAAWKESNAETIQLLLENGANVNQINSYLL